MWRRQDTGVSSGPDLFSDEGEERNTEHWTVYKMLRGHIEDVYDLSWSACSSFLVSGSIDNSAIMWDVNKGIITSVLFYKLLLCIVLSLVLICLEFKM